MRYVGRDGSMATSLLHNKINVRTCHRLLRGGHIPTSNFGSQLTPLTLWLDATAVYCVIIYQSTCICWVDWASKSRSGQRRRGWPIGWWMISYCCHVYRFSSHQCGYWSVHRHTSFIYCWRHFTHKMYSVYYVYLMQAVQNRPSAFICLSPINVQKAKRWYHYVTYRQAKSL